MNISNFYNDTKLNVNNWGPSFWYMLHLFSIKCDKNNKKQILYFFKYFACILPCVKCQSPTDGYPYFFNKYCIEPYIGTNKKIFLWTYNLHNYVNNKTGKPKFELSCNASYLMLSRLNIKFGHFVNFLINLSQISSKFKDDINSCKRINHIIANMLIIIKENIPEFGFYIETKYISKNNINTQNIIYTITDTIHNIKRACIYNLNNINTQIPGGKCNNKCNN